MKGRKIFSAALGTLYFFIPVYYSSAKIYNGDYPYSQRIGLYKDNKVWMVYGWTFTYENGMQAMKGKKTSYERFDREGNRIEEVNYDLKGHVVSACEYLFDEQGREVKKVGAQGEEDIHEKSNYLFLDSLNQVQRRSEYKKGKEYKWLYIYDRNHNVSEESCYDLNGDLSRKTRYTYNQSQKLSEKIELDSYGNVFQKWLYEYDDKGNNVEAKHYYSNEQLHRSYQMRYDKKGNMKSMFEFDKDENIVQLTVFIYQFYEGLYAPRLAGNK
jgi:hypothetical protein